ncbi:phosphopantetheine-binding protein [Parvibium lacunae]|uniref:Carrier domain-containing protein n=1 Tax=Parvibium lacunae TaxID=1888893 RepID=A0A368L0C9_9BURK|nr:phosphopantetheine-binding protein [Parvibium lacunae]RCS57020.1 hypothetical protein DU000_09440 [Parvibium lacunae]
MNHFESVVTAYLEERNQRDQLGLTIQAELPVFASGLLDSVAFTGLISQIESTLGGQIDMLVLDPEQIETLADLLQQLQAAWQA